MNILWRIKARLLGASYSYSIINIVANNSNHAFAKAKEYLKNEYPNAIVIIESVERIED